MFERNRVDNRAETLICVEVTIASGDKLSGRVSLAAGKPVHKLLDSDDNFIYAETFDGEGHFIPKSDIRGLKVINTGRMASMFMTVPDAKSFDPYRVLGLEKNAPFADIKEAHVRLTKLYHPDRYASVELPREVKVYIEAMSKNVNAAFQALKHVAHKSAPVYSRSR
jgi:hypothetical protein